MHIEIKVVRDSGIVIFSFSVNPHTHLNWYAPPGNEIVFENDKETYLQGLVVSPILVKNGELITTKEETFIEPIPVKKQTKRDIELEK